MAKSKAQHRQRQAVQEALATAVGVCAERAIHAARLATKDRRTIHDIEWERTDVDTLWAIDETADVLHGFANWTTNASPHPNADEVLRRLTELRPRLQSDLPALLSEHRQRCPRLWEYVKELADFRLALEKYFAEEAKARSTRRESGAAPGRQKRKRSA